MPKRGSDRFKVPAKISQASPTRVSELSISTHQSYLEFVDSLCDETSTIDAMKPTLRGLPLVVKKLESIHLDRDWRVTKDIAVYSFALVVHVWQLVCFKLLNGGVYRESDSLSTQTASYFLAAHSIVEELIPVDVDEFKFAIEYWEVRLANICGNSRWVQRNLLHEVDVRDPDAPYHRNEVANEYMKTLDEKGLFCFALDILHKEHATKTPGYSASPLRLLMQQAAHAQIVLGALIKMLFSMGTEIIKAIIEGQLQRKSMIFHSSVYNALNRNDRRSPGCYMNSICDRRGNSPTPGQWTEVCDLMLEYIEGGLESDHLAAEVDQLLNQSKQWPVRLATRGLRRYTEGKSYLEDRLLTACKDRRRMVRYFVSELQKRLFEETERAGEPTPLGAAVVEVGIARNPENRLSEHRRHVHSNYLLNLAEACFEHRFPGMFKLQQLVVFTCWRPEQSWLSEMFITRLAQGYVENGGGFSHYLAGLSNGNAYTQLSVDLWDRLQARVLTPDFVKAFGDLAEKGEAAQREREKSEATQAYVDTLAAFYGEMNSVLSGLGVE